MGRHSTAHYFLEALVDLGVQYIFANLGTDDVSLIGERAPRYTEVRKHPGMVPGHPGHGESRGSLRRCVHLVQAPFHIASLARPYVKSEYSLPSGVVVKEA